MKKLLLVALLAPCFWCGESNCPKNTTPSRVVASAGDIDGLDRHR